MTIDYQKFLEAKIAQAPVYGTPVAKAEINPILKPHQRAMVQWLVDGGRRACFAAFGLGKSVMQLETVRICRERAGGMALIVIPLGVRQEFMRDARTLQTGDHPDITEGQRLELRDWISGDESRAPMPKFIRRIEEATDPEGIYLTNYETIRDGKMDPRLFSVTSLDEASILRGFGSSKTFREFMALFAGDDRKAGVKREGIRYRFVATATPSPNEYIELLAYAAFLGIMDVGQAKTRFFRRNSEKADQLTLHAHKEREFWMWVASWALFVQKPSDLCTCSCHRENNLKGSDSKTGVSVRHTKTGNITEEEESASASNGATSSNSSETWGSLNQAQQSSAATTTATTSPETATGQAEKYKLETRGAQSSSATRGERSHSQLGQRNAASTTGSFTADTSSAGHRKGSSPTCCDICRCDEGYALPEMDIHWHEIPSDHSDAGTEKDGQGRLFRNAAIGVQDAAKEKRESLEARIAKLMQIRAEEPDEHRIVWHDLEAERHAIEKAVPGVVSVYGSQDLDRREQAIIDFSEGRYQELAAKPSIAGSGCNFQRHCARAVFLGIGFKFNDFIQAIHRIYRFLQRRRCRIDLIYTEAEIEVRRQLERKWQQHTHMVNKMTEIIREYGLTHAAMAATLARSLGVERVEASGDGYTVVNNDCVLETREMAENSIDLIVTSIPFATQYEYSPSYNDFGHTDDNAHFWQQMDYLVPELLRVLKPGRVAAIHVKDRITPGGINGLGFQTVHPFSDETVAHFTKHVFAFLARKTIVTDVVRENNQTYRLGWSEQCKDGSRMGNGTPEYLLVFRKPPSDPSNGYADLPVVKDKGKYTRARWQMDAHGFMRSSGNRPLLPEELEGLDQAAIFQMFKRHSLENVYDFRHDVTIAEAVDASGWLPTTFMLLQPQIRTCGPTWCVCAP